MTTALLLASMIAALLLGAQISRLPHDIEPGSVVIGMLKWLMWAQAFFAFTSFIGREELGRTERWYNLVYAIGMFPAATIALGLSFLALWRQRMYPIAASEVFLAAMLSWYVFGRYSKVPWGYSLMMTTGIAFTISGLFLLLSLDRRPILLWDSICLSIGAFLFVEGILHWALVSRLMAQQTRATAISLSNWVPTFAAICAFLITGWLIYNSRPST